MTKAQTVADALRGEGCLGRAEADEPVFVLRANDRIAPATIRDWVQRSKNAGMHEDKVEEAMEIAAEMERWRQAKVK